MSADESTAEGIAAWFGERLPREWVATAPEVTVDREEIVVVLALPGEARAEAGEATSGEARAGAVARFREETREQRISIAREAEHRYRRKVAWGVRSGETTEIFTSLAVPAMTRLRQPERMVLDTLVDAGVARSRAHALAWCVRLVGDNTAAWLGDLRAAMEHVQKVRAQGPATEGPVADGPVAEGSAAEGSTAKPNDQPADE